MKSILHFKTNTNLLIFLELFLICLIAPSCAMLKEKTPLDPLAKNLILVKKLPSQCFFLKDLNLSENSKDSVTGVIHQAKNISHELQANTILIEKIQTRRDGDWAYFKGKAYKCPQLSP